MAYVEKKNSDFGGFTGFITSFFSNLLSKVISINNIYTSVTQNQESGNLTGVYYDVARLTRILLDFEPIETSSFSLDYFEQDEDYSDMHEDVVLSSRHFERQLLKAMMNEEEEMEEEDVIDSYHFV